MLIFVWNCQTPSHHDTLKIREGKNISNRLTTCSGLSAPRELMITFHCQSSSRPQHGRLSWCSWKHSSEKSFQKKLSHAAADVGIALWWSFVCVTERVSCAWAIGNGSADATRMCCTWCFLSSPSHQSAGQRFLVAMWQSPCEVNSLARTMRDDVASCLSSKWFVSQICPEGVKSWSCIARWLKRNEE